MCYNYKNKKGYIIKQYKILILIKSLFLSFTISFASSPYADAHISTYKKPKDYILAVNLGSCQGCHGTDFSKSAMGKSKIVSQMSKKDIGDALVGYKNKTYGRDLSHIMYRNVAKYSDFALRNTGLGK